MLQAVSSQLRRSLILTNAFAPFTRSISLSTPRTVKEVVEHRDGKTLTIEGVVSESDRTHRLYQPQDRNGACPLCALGLDVKHTDVLILEQFLRPDGGMLPKRVTGLCSWQNRKVGILIAMALQAGLFPKYGTLSARLNTKWFYHHKRFNSYFDENTIEHAGIHIRRQRAKELEEVKKIVLAELKQR